MSSLEPDCRSIDDTRWHPLIPPPQAGPTQVMALCKLEEEMVYEVTQTLQDTVKCTPTNGYNPGELHIPSSFFSLLFVYIMNC